MLQKTPFSFDVSVWEFFWPLMTGARLVWRARAATGPAPTCADDRAREAITTMHFVPSMLRVFLEAAGARRAAPRCGGCSRAARRCRRELARRFFERLGAPGVELHNLYGPTEAAVDVTWLALPAGRRRPAGADRPPDRQHAAPRCSTGACGRCRSACPASCYIGGVQVGARLPRPARPDRRALRARPPLESRGGRQRGSTAPATWPATAPTASSSSSAGIDHQVKVRGFRIELGEIEAALAAPPGGARGGGGGGAARRRAARLACAGSCRPARRPPATSCARTSQARLPDYMVPSAWVALERAAAVAQRQGGPPGPARARPAAVADRVRRARVRTARRSLAAIWREVLGVERVGVDDNFFALGGDSILGIQILSRAAQRGLVLTARQIFRHPTVAELAAVVGRAAGDPGAAAPPAEAAAADFTESGLSERDLQKLMKKLGQAERGIAR